MFSLNLLFEVVIVYPELPVKLASYFDSLAASVIYTFLFNDLEIVLFQFFSHWYWTGTSESGDVSPVSQ